MKKYYGWKLQAWTLGRLYVDYEAIPIEVGYTYAYGQMSRRVWDALPEWKTEESMMKAAQTDGFDNMGNRAFVLRTDATSALIGEGAIAYLDYGNWKAYYRNQHTHWERALLIPPGVYDKRWRIYPWVVVSQAPYDVSPDCQPVN